METKRTKTAHAERQQMEKQFGTLDEFRRAYFPKDSEGGANPSDPESIGKELARRSAVLVKSAFASI